MTDSPTYQVLAAIWPWLLEVLSIFGVLLIILLVLHILRTPRTPAATLSWIFVILILPVFGILLYLLFGTRKLPSSLSRKEHLHLIGSEVKYPHPVHLLLTSLGIPASSQGNSVTFHPDGASAYAELLSTLESARDQIDIAMYIVGSDPQAKQVIACLEDKAASGVKVRVLLDAIGSFWLSGSHLRRLHKRGAEVTWFMPIFHRPFRGATNLRNHRKLVAVDGKRIWTGGRNIAREYLFSTEQGSKNRNASWLDLSFTLEGPASALYQSVFEADWAYATSEKTRQIEAPDTAHATNSLDNSRVQVVPSGPDVAEDPIYAALLTACYQAQERFLAVTPYYVPDAAFQEALRLAVLRGVVVDLILPKRSDHIIADIARSRYLRELSAAGARIWLVPDRMVHAKAIVIDKTLAISGTANLDVRSFFLNFELASCFYSLDEINWLEDWMTRLINQADLHQVKPAGALREVVEGVVLLGAYQL